MRKVYSVKLILEDQQSKGQVRFRCSVGVDDAFAFSQNACSNPRDWKVRMRRASFEYNAIEYNVLFVSMAVQGVRRVPHTHLKLVGSLYHDHVGMAQGRHFFLQGCCTGQPPGTDCCQSNAV